MKRLAVLVLVMAFAAVAVGAVRARDEVGGKSAVKLDRHAAHHPGGDAAHPGGSAG